MKELGTRLSIFSTFFLLFFYKGMVFLDPDFGWHIQMGKIILSTGIPKIDPFSYSMSSYPFIDHEWLTNVCMFVFYDKFGMISLAILFSLLTVVSIACITKGLSTTEAKIFFILSSSLFFTFAGVRTQVLTWFFFTLFLMIMFNQHFWIRFRYVLPFLMLLWVNMHGGFALGVVSLIVIFSANSISRKRIHKDEIIVFILCFLATFLNPYGYRIWWEIWMQMSDSTLHWSISEWMPVLINPIEIGLLFFIALSFAQVIVLWKKFTLSELLMYAALLFAGLSSIRQIPLWVLVADILLLKSYQLLKQMANQYTYGPQRFHKLNRILGVIILVVTGIQVIFSLITIQEAMQDFPYPKQAVKILQKELPRGNIFSIYNWGGYLIWQLPQKKVYIDGRMPSWRWNASLPHETNYAFHEYQEIGEGKIPIHTIVLKYGITTFLIPSQPEAQVKKSFITTFVNNLDQLFLGNKQKNSFDLQNALRKDGFIETYHDHVALIYSLEKR